MKIKALLFMEGFISLALQLLFFRQLSPHVGGASITDGWIIGVFLAALSFGYEKGGKYNANPINRFATNLVIACSVAGVFASAFMTSVHFQLWVETLGRLNTLILYCVIFVGPIAYLMGQSLPLLMQAHEQSSSKQQKASEVGGRSLFISTIGSTAGAIIPMSYIAPRIGANETLLLIVFLGLTTAFLVTTSKRIKITCLLSFAMSYFFIINVYEKIGENFTSTAYSDISLRKDQKTSESIMLANGLIMSSHVNGVNSAEYLNTFHATLLENNILDHDIFIMGGGGFMAHTIDKSNNRYTYVDIDPTLKAWAVENFSAQLDNVEIYADDARSFIINQPDASMDLILVDTYSSRFDTPAHLVTQEFYQLIKAKLKPNGYLAINTIGNDAFGSDYSANLHVTITSVFPFCQTKKSSKTYNGVSNVQYFCYNLDRVPTIYTDNKNNAPTDSWNSEI